MLKCFGIDVDDPANGVFIPETLHDHLHTNAYYDAVNDALHKQQQKQKLKKFFGLSPADWKQGLFHEYQINVSQ